MMIRELARIYDCSWDVAHTHTTHIHIHMHALIGSLRTPKANLWRLLRRMVPPLAKKVGILTMVWIVTRLFV